MKGAFFRNTPRGMVYNMHGLAKFRARPQAGIAIDFP